ncbi:piggyBac transposable element-derived protein 3-like [Amphibalanus amphitrite]|uniref:piggyBac transposable element-derived protein 3-like n=1 Tax=Amphibalanus amphitrite TaxID=1232801 RepID=UPI001C8FE7DC|nr:piggyBac transposable element-derived protein 3-like [Amphibalanus amphitrite]
MEAQSSEDEDVEEDKDEEEEGEISRPPASKKAKRPTTKKVPARPTTWQKVDVSYPALPAFEHPAPLYVRSPQQYFFTFFSEQMVRHIAYQTNLYATQKDVNTTFSTTDDEIVNFVAVLLYMGVMEAPSLEDYWSMKLRVPQVAEVMSSKRFRLLRRTLHFNDNSRAGGSVDRFFKIRPLFSFINTSFQSVPQTSRQSIDEVMVGYKGKTAGNLRQYIRNKPDKWGFKLFSRASEDGFVHDMVLYQGKTTLRSHGVTMTSAEEAMGVTSQIVAALVSTMNLSSTTVVFADNYFTSLELVRYLQGKGCRYTGTARDNRIGKPPLKSVKDMEKKSVPRGSIDYVTSDDGILAVRWKDNKVVTMLSTDLGVEPVTTCQRYSNETKKKDDVPCPEVIKSYNANMGGIDKSDMLIHLPQQQR